MFDEHTVTIIGDTLFVTGIIILACAVIIGRMKKKVELKSEFEQTDEFKELHSDSKSIKKP